MNLGFCCSGSDPDHLPSPTAPVSPQGRSEVTGEFKVSVFVSDSPQRRSSLLFLGRMAALHATGKQPDLSPL